MFSENTDLKLVFRKKRYYLIRNPEVDTLFQLLQLRKVVYNISKTSQYILLEYIGERYKVDAIT